MPATPRRARASLAALRTARSRGIYAPVHALSDSAPGAFVIAPGDVRGTRMIPEMRGGACCGLDGADGPNMACVTCDLPVATRIDDCSLWQAVRLSPDAVRRVRLEGAHPPPLSWTELTEQGASTPPFEPISTWGGRFGASHYWSWSPQWEAAAGHALAHLLAASEGQPVTVPKGHTADVFQLVPVHPQTGRTWAPDGPATSAYRVPLPLGVWLWLVSAQPYLPVPATGRLPHDVLRDEPLPPRPNYLFRADWGAFQHTLVRLRAVRSPWLRTILESLPQDGTADFF